MEGQTGMRFATVALVVFVTAVLLCSESSSAMEYHVGDQSGWSYDVDYNEWVKGKTFHVGDVLVFTYDASSHNVLEVNKAGYDKCKSSPNKATYSSGSDRITLKTTGTKYFICEYHCDYANGQKVRISVS